MSKPQPAAVPRRRDRHGRGGRRRRRRGPRPPRAQGGGRARRRQAATRPEQPHRHPALHAARADAQRRPARGPPRPQLRSAAMGYTEVEMAGYYGLTAQQFRSLARRAGLRAVSGPRRPRPRRAEHDLGGRLRADARERQHDWARSSPASPGSPGRTRRRVLQVPRRALQRGGARWPRRPASSSSTTTTTSSSRTSRPTASRRSTTSCSTRRTANLVQVRARPLLDHRRRREPARVPQRATRPRYFAYHVKDRDWKDRPERGRLRGRRPRRDRLPATSSPRATAAAPDKHYFIEHDSPLLSHPDLGTPRASSPPPRSGIELPAQRHAGVERLSYRWA